MINNKSVVAIFIIGVALLLVAFWAGLNVIRDNRSASATQSARETAPQPGAQQGRAGAQSSPDSGQSRGQESTGANAATAPTRYLVLVAAFGTDTQANKLTMDLRRKYPSAYTQQPPGGEDTLYRVYIGPYPKREDAETVANELASEGRKGVMIVPKTQS
jgi:cell division septation protein DedD